MKRLSKHILLLVAVLLPLCVYATLPYYSITVVKVVVSESPEEPDDLDPGNRGHRIPSVPIECVITSDGIQLMSSSVAVSDIISFEIWDAESEFCMASFSAESDFITTLFSMPSGDYQIRLVTDDYELVGYIVL